MLKRSAVPLLLVVLAVTAGACHDTPSTVPPPPDEALASAGSGRVKEQFRTLDEEFGYLVGVVPGGFGGMYFDADGRPVVALKDMRKKNAAAGVLSTHFRKRAGQHGNGRNRFGEMRFVQGKHDFVELGRWRREIEDRLLSSIPGLVSIDVDEVRNRVVLGVLDGGAMQRARDAVSRIGIPTDAVIVEPREPYREVVDLDDRVPLVAGGYFIQWVTGQCTLGFNAYQSGIPVFVTASHCSDTKWAPDANENYYQWRTLAPEDIIGYEYKDPYPYYDSACSTTYNCRWSDALLGRWTNTSRMDFGRIARTTGQNNGSIVVSSTTPTFSILDKIMYGMVGDVVHKVGAITGWTSGSITRSCVGILQGTTYAPCQEEAPFNAQQGDSGSPVFSMSSYSGWVYLRGIMWGPRAFSDMFGVEEDLGALDVVLCNTSHPWYPNC